MKEGMVKVVWNYFGFNRFFLLLSLNVLERYFYFIVLFVKNLKGF